MTGKELRGLARLLGLLVLLAFAFQGTRGMWEPDEGRYTSVGINMLQSGDWLVPTIDGEHAHLAKPPVTYWAVAASFGLFGRSEWAARLPAALAFIGTGLFVLGLGRRLCADRPWLPSLVWSLSLAPVITANIVSTDALLMMFETAAMYAFVEAWVRPAGQQRGWLILMWCALGLAFMTKGPPGLMPLYATLAYLAVHERNRLRGLFEPVGLVVFAVTAFTWFALVIGQDPGRLQHFLGYEIYDRVFTATHNRNAAWYGGLLVYVPVLLVGALPWSVLAVIAGGGPRAALSRVIEGCRKGNAQLQLLLYWFCVPLAIFMLARSRLHLYIVPLFVPLALACARALAHWPWLSNGRLKATAAATAIALLAIKGTLAYWHTDHDARYIARAFTGLIDRGAYDGIVFVDMHPFYGLNLYLGQQPRWLSLAAGAEQAQGTADTGSLCTEMARNSRTLFALKASKAGMFLAGAAKCGGPAPVEIGRLQADGNEIALFMMRRGTPAS